MSVFWPKQCNSVLVFLLLLFRSCLLRKRRRKVWLKCSVSLREGLSWILNNEQKGISKKQCKQLSLMIKILKLHNIYNWPWYLNRFRFTTINVVNNSHQKRRYLWVAVFLEMVEFAIQRKLELEVSHRRYINLLLCPDFQFP